MNKTAITSGGAGDVIISVPVMKMLGISSLYIKESFYPEGYGSMFSALRELIEMQGFRVLPTKDLGQGFDQFEPGIRYDVNMDAWRGIRGRGRDYIGHSMAMWFRVGRPDYTRPWLQLDAIPTEWTGQNYTLWYLSPRWRQSDTDWKAVYQSVPGCKLFVGFAGDYAHFSELVDAYPGWVFSDNFLFTARLVRDARAVYCNQGPVLALAGGLGVHHYCAYKKNKTNCRTYTRWDHPL
jgi:hypothetical protein